jgi:hypothetical protein
MLHSASQCDAARTRRRPVTIDAMKIWPLFAVAGGVVALFALDILHVEDFVQVGCRGKQAEAKSMLKQAQKRLNDHGNRNTGRIPSQWADLGWEPKTNRYAYLISVGFNGHFIVEANAKTNEMNGDVWQIDETGALTNKVNGCAR